MEETIELDNEMIKGIGESRYDLDVILGAEKPYEHIEPFIHMAVFYLDNHYRYRDKIKEWLSEKVGKENVDWIEYRFGAYGLKDVKNVMYLKLIWNGSEGE